MDKNKTSKAMRAYLERAREHDEFMRTQLHEYKIGKRHLANMMGEDPDTFTQEDIDVSFLLYIYHWSLCNNFPYLSESYSISVPVSSVRQKSPSINEITRRSIPSEKGCGVWRVWKTTSQYVLHWKAEFLQIALCKTIKTSSSIWILN